MAEDLAAALIDDRVGLPASASSGGKGRCEGEEVAADEICRPPSRPWRTTRGGGAAFFYISNGQG